MMEELYKISTDKEPSLEDRIAELEESIIEIQKEVVSIYDILKELATNK